MRNYGVQYCFFFVLFIKNNLIKSVENKKHSGLSDLLLRGDYDLYVGPIQRDDNRNA